MNGGSAVTIDVWPRQVVQGADMIKLSMAVAMAIQLFFWQQFWLPSFAENTENGHFQKPEEDSLDAALEMARDKLHKRESDPIAWMDFAAEAEGLGRLSEAKNAYDEFIRKFPSDPHCTLAKAMIARVTANGQAFPENIARQLHDDDYILVDTTKNFHLNKWRPGRMPLRISIKSLDKDMPFDVNAMTLKAASAWSSESQKKISFKVAPPGTPCDVEVLWTTNLSNDELSDRQGSTRLSFEGAQYINHVTITVLAKNRVNGAVESEQRAFEAVLHEIGHALGVRHSKDQHDVMSNGGSFTLNKLSTRDISMLRRLYNEPAEELVSKAIAIVKPLTNDADSQLMAGLYKSHGRALSDVNKYSEAKAEYEKALSIQERLGYKDRMDLFGDLNDLANTNYDMKDYAAALPIYERARDILIKEKGSRERVYWIDRCLFTCHYELGQHAEAEQVGLTSLNYLRSQNKPSESLADCTFKVATVQAAQKHTAQAAANFKTANDLYVKLNCHSWNAEQCEKQYQDLAGPPKGGTGVPKKH